MFWDITKSLSYNCLFNFIVGDRGVGKTFGCKKYVIDKYLKTGAQFVYVRRTKRELKGIRTFFADISSNYENNFQVVNDGFKIDKKQAGYYLNLSTAQQQKSVAYPNVETIIFDEFIINDGYVHYLPSEVLSFLELYSTIARLRDVKVYFLSNALTTSNPYFTYFNIELPYQKKISAKNDILIEIATNKEYVNTAKNTRFGKLVANTEYGEYAYGSKFLLDNNNFIAKKPYTCKYYFTLYYKEFSFGVWFNSSEASLYVSKDIDPNYKEKYSVTLDSHNMETIFIDNKSIPVINDLIKHFKNGKLYFDDIKIKNIFMQALKRIL